MRMMIIINRSLLFLTCLFSSCSFAYFFLMDNNSCSCSDRISSCKVSKTKPDQEDISNRINKAKIRKAQVTCAVCASVITDSTEETTDSSLFRSRSTSSYVIKQNSISNSVYKVNSRL